MTVDAKRLRHDLIAANYTTDAVLSRIGEAGQAGLHRNTTLAAEAALGEASDPLASLIRLFILQQPVARPDVKRALDAEALIQEGLLAEDNEEVGTGDGSLRGDAARASDRAGAASGDGVHPSKGEEAQAPSGEMQASTGQVWARVDVRPYGSEDDGSYGYLISDLTPGLNGSDVATFGNYVLGASPASLTLTQITMRDQVGAALDLGTGCGVQSLHLARHSDRVVATDLNPRALELAALSFELSQVDVELRHGSLFEPVGDERFDLIVSNPPYVMAPPESDRLTYRQAGLAGDQLTETLIRQAPRHLNPGGSMQLLTNWAVVESQDWRERLASWVEPTGCDAWIIERERLDRFDYIEMWLTDAGLAGTPQWRDHYQRWLTYFDELGIHEVGMGWILLTHAGRQQPHVRIESWPHQVAQPVAEMFSRHRDALDAALLPESELLTLRPRLHRVAQEAIGDPGASDPRHIVLRQQTGLLRGMEVSTVTGAVLGALDGDLSVGVVIQAVAELLEIPVDQVAAEALPLVRQTLEEQYLIVGPI